MASYAALVSRQFVDMSRIRIEGLLAAFPKLVGSGKQHTYVETENVRYLYQPVEVKSQFRWIFFAFYCGSLFMFTVIRSFFVCHESDVVFLILVTHANLSLSFQGMYLLLVTNKASNILEDLETLRLLSKVLPEFVMPPIDEESIGESAFELLFAFDEVISLGYKENVTVGQVKQNTEMESHEEKLHKMIIASKVSDTKVRIAPPLLL